MTHCNFDITYNQLGVSAPLFCIYTNAALLMEWSNYDFKSFHYAVHSPSIFSLRIQQECTAFGTAHIVHCKSM